MRKEMLCISEASREKGPVVALRLDAAQDFVPCVEHSRAVFGKVIHIDAGAYKTSRWCGGTPCQSSCPDLLHLEGGVGHALACTAENNDAHLRSGTSPARGHCRLPTGQCSAGLRSTSSGSFLGRSSPCCSTPAAPPLAARCSVHKVTRHSGYSADDIPLRARADGCARFACVGGAEVMCMGGR